MKPARFVAFLLVVSALAVAANAAPPARASSDASDDQKPKKAGPTKHELAEQNVRFQTPGDWELGGSGAANCKGGFVMYMGLPFKPSRAQAKPKPKKGDTEPAKPPILEVAPFFTLVVDPAEVDGSSLDAALTTMQAAIKKTYADATFLPARDVKLADEPAKQFVASFSMPSPLGGQAIPRKQSIVMARHAGKVYRLALEASVADFEKEKGALERVKTTVAWLDEVDQKGSPVTGGKPFRNADHGLQLQLPAGWDNGELSMPGAIAVFFPPNDAKGDVSLFTRDPQGKDAEAVLTALQGEIRDHDANAKFDEMKDATLGGEPARVLTYQLKLAGGERSGLMLASVHAGKAYVLKFSGPATEYEKHVAAVHRMIDSFRWASQVGGNNAKNPATRPTAAR